MCVLLCLIEGYISRILKTVEAGKTVYEIRHAGVENKELYQEEYEGCLFKVTTGDYNDLLKNVVDNLGQAMKHAVNSNEKNMVEQYMKSFTEGSLDRQKDGSLFWIKNKGPIVETYIDFIETYRDPKWEEMLPKLPCPAEFEKDVLTFAGSGVPAGINSRDVGAG